MIPTYSPSLSRFLFLGVLSCILIPRWDTSRTYTLTSCIRFSFDPVYPNPGHSDSKLQGSDAGLSECVIWKSGSGQQVLGG